MQRYLQHVKAILSYVLPIAGNRLFNIVSTIVPVFFLSQVNKYELAAAALAGSAFVTFLQFGRGFFGATGILISHRVGLATDKSAREIGCVYRNSLLLGCCIGVVSLTAMWHMDVILLWFGQDPNLVSLCHLYFYYAGWALLILMVGLPAAQLYTAMGRPRVNLWVSACRAPFTIVLSYAFIFGRWGLPALGLGGIMMGIFITQVPVSMLMCVMAYCSPYNKKYGLYKGEKWFDGALCRQQIAVGLPISLQSSSEMIGVTVMLYFMGWFGPDALAAAQIVSQYVIVLVVFYLGCSQAMSVMVSKAHAQGKGVLIQEYTLASMGLMTLFIAVIAAVFVFFHRPLTELFLNADHSHHHQHILELAKYFFWIAIFMNYCDGIRYILAGTYRGLHDSKTPMVAGLVGICVIGVVASYVMGVTLQWQAVGVRLGLTVGILISLLWLMIPFFKRTLPALLAE